MKDYNIRFYLGKFGNECLLFKVKNENPRIPQKDEFIYFEGEMYKVLYIMTDIDNNGLDVFVRYAIEEDY